MKLMYFLGMPLLLLPGLSSAEQSKTIESAQAPSTKQSKPKLATQPFQAETTERTECIDLFRPLHLPDQRISNIGQVWGEHLGPMRYHEGPGVKLTDSLVFHPGIVVEGRYDSNVFYNIHVRDAPFMQMIGHLHLATLSPKQPGTGGGGSASKKVSFRLHAAAAFRNYFSNNEFIKQQRALEVDAGFAGVLFPDGMVSLGLADDFQRLVLSANGEYAGNQPLIINQAQAKIRLKPMGDQLEFRLNYGLDLISWEEKAWAFANKLTHEVQFIGKYKIFSEITMMLVVQQEIIRYTDPTRGMAEHEPNLINNNAYPLRLYIGLAGLITPELRTKIKVGYGNSFHEKGDSYQMLVAMVQLGYTISEMNLISFGYERRFHDTSYANYFSDDRAYLAYQHLFFRRISLELEGDYRFRNYGGYRIDLPDLRRHIVGINVNVDYFFKEWFYLGLGYVLQLKKDISDTHFYITSLRMPRYLGYTKHQLLGRVGVSY